MSGALVVGAGLVGSFAARALLAESYDVTLVDPRPDPDYVRRVAGVGCSIVSADAGDRELFARVIASRKPEVVIWAGAPSGGSARATAAESVLMNVTLPRTVAEQALAGGTQRFVYVSSFAVYGGVHAERAVESQALAPVSAYGRSKLNGERALIELRAEGLDVRILRPCGLYGPIREGTGSRSARLVATLVAAAVEGRSVALPYSVTDELLYAKDFGRAVALAALRDLGGKPEIFNVGIGRHVRLEDIVATLRTIAPGTDISLPVPVQPMEASIPPLDVSKIRSVLGFVPEYDVEAALRDYLVEMAVPA